LALRVTGWRTIFVVLGLVTFVAALAIAWRVPDTGKPAVAAGLRTQWGGVRTVLGHARLWWIAPLAAICMGSFTAIQGLWAVPWLMEVAGQTRADAAGHLLCMAVVLLAGYVALGFCGTRLARRGVHARHLFATGFALAIVAFAGIFLLLPGSYFWWGLYGLGSAANVLAFTVLNEGFRHDLFILQWGIGLVAEVARVQLGYDNVAGLRLAFGLVLAGNVLTYAWFLRGWQRHAHLSGAAQAG
jgi:predicted MFS family arabinose efflux permease